MLLLEGLDVVGGRRSSGRRGRRRAAAASDLARGGRRAADWKIGPSSQSSSSQRSASKICSTFSGVERSRSVSSMRSTSVAAACRGRAASCRAPCARRRCAGRRSARERSGRAWTQHARTAPRHADRRPRLPRRRPGERRRARRRARLPRDPDLQPEPARVEADASTPTRRSPRSARRSTARAIDALLIHAVYLLNCASEDPEIRDEVADVADARRCASGDALGADGVVLHPGSAKTGDVGAGDRARRRGDRARRWPRPRRCPLHLEDTAGAGGTLGRSFEELARAARGRPAAASGSASAWTPATCSPPATTSARAEALAERARRVRRDRRPRPPRARCTSTTR